MKPKSKNPGHTPGPWKQNGMTSITTLLTSDGPQATVDPIADVYHPGANQCLSMEEYKRELAKAEANAAFIVRAVNAHEELLEAAKMAKEFIERFKSCVPDWAERMKCSQEGYTTRLEAAILKAEGGK